MQDYAFSCFDTSKNSYVKNQDVMMGHCKTVVRWNHSKLGLKGQSGGFGVVHWLQGAQCAIEVAGMG